MCSVVGIIFSLADLTCTTQISVTLTTRNLDTLSALLNWGMKWIWGTILEKKRQKVIIQMNLFLALNKELILFSTELPRREIKFEGYIIWPLYLSLLSFHSLSYVVELWKRRLEREYGMENTIRQILQSFYVSRSVPLLLSSHVWFSVYWTNIFSSQRYMCSVWSSGGL
jgi:hypothetical protein